MKGIGASDRSIHLKWIENSEKISNAEQLARLTISHRIFNGLGLQRRFLGSSGSIKATAAALSCGCGGRKIIRIDKKRLARRNPSRGGDPILPSTATCFKTRAGACSVTGRRRSGESWERGSVSNSNTTALSLALPIPLALPSLQAKALAHFVKRVDFETVAGLSSVAVVVDGKSEADLIWLALAELRRALAEANAAPQATRPCTAPLTVIPGPGPSHRSSWVRR